MAQIGVRELRQHASRYLEKVKAGEVVERAHGLTFFAQTLTDRVRIRRKVIR